VSIQNDVSFRDRISHGGDFRLRSLATSQRMIIVIMTTAPPADPAGFLASKEAIDAIDRICRRCFPDETEAVECSTYIIEHLMADDYRRLRLFQARNTAKFQTYLTTLINALATDFSRGRYGRKRIPKVVSRMGETAEKIYVLICWKNYSFSEGFDILCIRHEYSGSFQDYETRFGPVQAAPCRRNPVRFSIDNIDGPVCDLPDPKANPLEYLLENLDRSRRITAGKIIREAIATRDELDQLLFRLRFADDLSLARIAQVAGITENMVQKRVKKLVLYCREKLLSAGIGSL
jgi:RNA polymerase sigma factor (sigma-70 family)